MKTAFSLIAIACLWVFVQNEDYNEMQEQAARDKAAKQEKIELQKKKNEAYNQLAKEGKRLTGFDGEIK